MYTNQENTTKQRKPTKTNNNKNAGKQKKQYKSGKYTGNTWGGNR